MTETRRWLERRRRGLLRLSAAAGVLLTLGAVLAALAVGVVLGRLGLYREVPPAVLAAWIAALGAVAWGVVHWRRRHRELAVMSLADTLERAGGKRRGSVAGVAAWDEGSGSSSLASLADGRVAAWLRTDGAAALGGARRRAGRSLWAGAAVFAVATLGFAGAGPGAGEAAPLWRPLAALAPARGPVMLAVDRTAVRRGERVTASVTAVGRRGAELLVRAPGEAWHRQSLMLDSAGEAIVVLGPLESDRYLQAESGGAVSEVVHVRVALPALLAELQLLARYPAYLERADEPVPPGPESLALPVGTTILTRGRATLPLERVRWEGNGATVPLAVDGETFQGALRVSATAEWRLAAVPLAGGAMDDPAPLLSIVAVPDSAPQIAVPIPGRDTTASLSLRQAVLIDARDDHRLTRVEVVSWRVSRLGVRGDPLTEVVPLPDGGADRVVLHWVLDLNGRGLLPGDTAFFLVRAHDNRPPPQLGESEVYALRLPAMAELREAMRQASRGMTAEADSLVAVQRELARNLEDLAAERERGATGDATEQPLPFNSVERARELLAGQEEMLERASQLTEELRALSDAAWAAGLTDPEFHRQLRELQDLMRRALSDELAERLAELRAALEHLDAGAARDALRKLARAADQLRDELERGRQLFERAALEGEMTSLAEDAEELAARQREWNDRAETGVDTAAAVQEEVLGREAETLAEQLEQLQVLFDSVGVARGEVGSAPQEAAEAAAQMREAAAEARRRNAARARRSGEAASQQLDPLAQRLRARRDELREEWRQQVLAELDRAMVETATLARRQEEIMQRLDRGESGPDVRGAQAAVREGVDRLIEQLQSAAGKNALVSPRLGAALGGARLGMSESLDQLQRPTPNAGAAAARAGEALDALNAMIYAMLQSRGDVAGAQSGSGVQEAVERMAQLAEQQGALSGETGSLLSAAPAGADQLMQQLRALAQRQRALAAELERLNAEGDVSGAGEFAEEAEEIAGDLERGRLDRETVERQERLFRRLLDAGRTLESGEEDERRDRTSESADPANVRLPETGDVPAGQARYRYPTWEELRALSPEERRLILDYFRRLNAKRP
jgi:hypothetical protein